ncbi:hypothetical protein RhiirA4_483651 [Rhizophagus irregularis]|uniref:Uncharacterized protein n=1 Tax=Rhizophagus irregularis TaxID=588596 RepID=A0A2I1HMV5_9GLOM|nr:hypothetical protein RhiirA4_483651 [Rhizophagus irregularis]
MSHERRGCIAHHDILHQRPGPSWDQPVQMDFGFAGHPHYKICYRLPIANPDHSEYLGHCPAKPYKFPTIMALQAEFNEIMERQRYNEELDELSDLISPKFVKKKKKKKKKQNKKTD